MRKRRRKERLFRASGMAATGLGVAFLALFFISLVFKGASAFTQSFVQLDVEFTTELLAPNGELDLAVADVESIVRGALFRQLPEVPDRAGRTHQ